MSAILMCPCGNTEALTWKDGKCSCSKCGITLATQGIPGIAIPKPLATQDFTVVSQLVVDHVNAMSKPDYCEDNDTAHYIYEACMEAVYGKDIWTWVRKLLI